MGIPEFYEDYGTGNKGGNQTKRSEIKKSFDMNIFSIQTVVVYLYFCDLCNIPNLL